MTDKAKADKANEAANEVDVTNKPGKADVANKPGKAEANKAEANEAETNKAIEAE